MRAERRKVGDPPASTLDIGSPRREDGLATFIRVHPPQRRSRALGTRLELYRAFAETVGPFVVRGSIQYPQRLGEGFRYDPLARRATRLPDPSHDTAVGR
jgi:hypothetical protein